MNFKKIDCLLKEINKREQYYKKNNQLSDFYQKLKQKSINGEKVYLFDDLIPDGQDYAIVKHTRFVPVPLHIHSFIELNYVYSGECTQIIDGQVVNLKRGQICLIDTSVPHSIENTTESDIIINLLVKKNYFQKQLSQERFEGGIVFDFMVDALSDRQTHNQYIVFNNNHDDQIHLTIQQILLENFESKIGSSRIIENLIAILFTLLVRDFNYQTNKKAINGKAPIVDILQYIEKQYLTISLEDLSQKFNYTPTYLSSLIRKETGKTFSQIIIERKLEHAKRLIEQNTNPIYVNAMEAGFSNITFFYKKFNERYGMNPGQISKHKN